MPREISIDEVEVRGFDTGKLEASRQNMRALKNDSYVEELPFCEWVAKTMQQNRSTSSLDPIFSGNAILGSLPRRSLSKGGRNVISTPRNAKGIDPVIMTRWNRDASRSKESSQQAEPSSFLQSRQRSWLLQIFLIICRMVLEEKPGDLHSKV